MPTRRLPSQLPMQTRAATVDADAIDIDKRTVRVTFSTGAAVRRRRYVGWDSSVEFDESLVISRAAVQLDRLNAGGAVLDCHFGYSTEGQVGVVERAWIEGAQPNAEAKALIRFPAAGIDEAADRLFGKVADGIVRSVSCGYFLNEVEVIPANEKKGTVEQHRVTRWTPYEISFVPTGADPKAQVRGGSMRQEAESLYPVNFNERAGDGLETEHSKMDREQLINEACRAAGFADRAATYIAGPMTIDQVKADLARLTSERNAEAERTRQAQLQQQQQEQSEATRQAIDQAVAAERTRIADIQTACRDFGFPDLADGFIKDPKADINAVRAQLQAKLAERSRNQAPGARPHAQAANNGSQDETATRINLMSNALANRISPKVKLEEGARQYRGMTLIDMARECLEANGISTRMMSRLEIANQTFMQGSSAFALRAAGYHTTSDFPIILGNQVNRTLREAYELAPQTYKRIARRSTATDFRPIIRAQIGDNPRLLKVNEHGEFKYGTIGEGSESYRLLTYGRILGVTRQVLINDDLGAFDRVPSGWGRAAAALENEIVWALITGNPVMADGFNLFSSQHGNVSPNNDAINVNSVGEGRHAMRMQRGVDANAPDGEQAYRLNIVPNIIAAPSAQEKEVLQFLSPVVVPTSDQNVNVFKTTLEPLIEPLLDDASQQAWYLFAESFQGLEYAFLDGQEGVATDVRVGFEVDGMEFKVRHDFGAGVIDFRGMYKNAGEDASDTP